MIKERYVSFEVAKMLKEKGFDEPCRAVYEEKVLRINTLCDYLNSELSSYVCAPTLYMTMEWLREKGIEIETRVDFDCMSEPPTYAFVGYSAKIYTIEKAINVDEIHIDRYETYEEAVEVSIIFALENLI